LIIQWSVHVVHTHALLELILIAAQEQVLVMELVIADESLLDPHVEVAEGELSMTRTGLGNAEVSGLLGVQGLLGV
jgi:hypothetical protein